MAARAGILDNKLVLVTGASRGIGQSIAEAYAKEGGQLILTAEPAQEKDLHKVADNCNKHGKKAKVLLCNLANASEIDKLVNSISSDHPDGLNVLVNNAGILGPINYDKGPNMGQGPFDGNVEEWEEVIKVNVMANMRLTKALVPKMQERQEGWVLNINSSNGLKPGPASPIYCASKWAMRGWSLSCHEALKEQGIRVVTIYPPATATPMTWDRPDLDPIVELEAQPEDIAEAALMPFRFSQNALPLEIVIQTLKNYKKN